MSVTTTYYLPLNPNARNEDLLTEADYLNLRGSGEAGPYYFVGTSELDPRLMNKDNVKVGETYSFIFEEWMVRDYNSNLFKVVEIYDDGICVEMLNAKNYLGFTDEELKNNPELKRAVLSFNCYWINNSKCWCAYSLDDDDKDDSYEDEDDYDVEDNDNVNHPSHYAGAIECKDAMIQQFGTEKYKIFCQLNAFKYLWRSDMKHETPDEDLAKAGWYLVEYAALSVDDLVAAKEAQEGTSNTSDEEVPTEVYEPILGHFKSSSSFLESDEGYKPYRQSELYELTGEDPYEQFICKETDEVYGRLISFISGKRTIYDFKYNTYWQIEKDDLDWPDEDGYYILVPVGSNRMCEKWKISPECAKKIMVRECKNV